MVDTTLDGMRRMFSRPTAITKKGSTCEGGMEDERALRKEGRGIREERQSNREESKRKGLSC